MKLKKLVIIILTAVLIFPTFGCVMLPPDSSSNVITYKGNKTEEFLALGLERGDKLLDSTIDDFYYYSSKQESFSNVEKRYFTTNLQEGKKSFFYMKNQLESAAPYFFHYFSEIVGKEVINFDANPFCNSNSDYILYSYPYDGIVTEYKYEIIRMDGYKYNIEVRVYAGDEVAARIIAWGYSEDELLDMVKTKGYQVQINEDKDSIKNIDWASFRPFSDYNQKEDYWENVYVVATFHMMEEFISFKNKIFISEIDETKDYYFFINREDCLELDLDEATLYHYNFTPIYGKEMIALDEPSNSYSLLSFSYNKPCEEYKYVLESANVNIRTSYGPTCYNRVITVYAGDEAVALLFYNTKEDFDDEFYMNFIKTYGYQTQARKEGWHYN